MPGYGRRDIKIEINEDGSRITISCEQLEMVRGFHKTFKIPEGVVLDKVKARFDQDESRLTIRMPKAVKGLVTGIGIKELEDVENHQETVGSNHLKEEKHVHEYNKDNNIIQSENQENVLEKDKQVEKTEDKNDTQEEVKPRSIICSPIIAGSALFVSLIVVVFSLIRSKSESNQKKNY